MASVKLTICNMAMRALGAEPVTQANLDDEDIEPARILNDLYEPMLEETLTAHPWDFAKVKMSLDPAPISPMFDYTYAYEVPSDCLRVLRMEDDEEYKIEGEFLITDESEAKAEYITLITAYDPYTKAMLHFDGADAATTTTESKASKTVTVGGTAQLDTAQYKFSTASLLLDGDSDYITMPVSKDWNFYDFPFTIDMWIRIATDQDAVLIGQYYDSSNYWYLKYSATDSELQFKAVVAGTTIADYDVTWNPTVSTWYHLELARNGDDIYLFIDGVEQTLTENTAISGNMPALNAVLCIGCQNSTDYFAGWIDELRISKGIARHTDDFLPETVAYGGTTREEKFKPTFVSAFAIRLAAEAAYPITGKQELFTQKYTEYKDKLKLAKTINAQEGVTKPVEESPWLEARDE